MNDYMYSMLREYGVAARIDEDIGIEFIDLNQSVKKQDNFFTLDR